MLTRLSLFITLVVLFPLHAHAANESNLPRRAFLGAALDLKGAAAERGVRLGEVLPDSSAQAAGLAPGDVVLRVDGKPMEGEGRLAVLMQTIAHAHVGQTLDATILRNEAEQSVALSLKEYPRESAPDYDTIYDSVDVGGFLHRVIVTVPRAPAPHPAMLFLQGLGCSSVEAPLQPADTVRQLIAGVTRGGYATVRVEKSGCGDSQGPPCSEMDFQTELKAYLAAADYTLKRDGLDASRVFVFGHSMGGVFAPLVAAERKLAGVMVYGAMGVDLPKYFAENDARQMPMSGDTGARLEAQLQFSRDFVHLFLEERLTPAQVTEREPELRAFVRARTGDDTHLFGRHYAFWYQLDDLDLPAPWTKVEVPVLALWGTSDFASTRGDHVVIADTVNARHPGLAEFREVPGTGHGFERSASMAESARNHMQGEFNVALATTCTEWMNKAQRAK